MRPVEPIVTQFPTLVVNNATSGEEAQWQIRPVGPGSVCYHLVRYRQSDPWNTGTDAEVAAVYHHAGPHLSHPLDHGEGVLLVPENQDPNADVLVVAMVVVLLWYIREIDVPAPAKASSLSKLLGSLRISKDGTS
ncbi:uncharacterized protein PG998_005297 [Apiospora kogelbergensis]|uniref:Uncharacterized protein n=1 Tax=Apiospora kogelbergensis TaxID=1337665 RepID=A0AAW0Q8I6_9PEZI